MIFLLSPSKSQNFSHTTYNFATTIPQFHNEIIELVAILRQKSMAELKSLMNISDALAKLNYERYQQYQEQFTSDTSKPAILSFTGDVYDGIDVIHYTDEDFAFAQEHLRILSGLYGLLRPLDLIQPYRLEMATRLKHKNYKDLYQFWNNKITDALNNSLVNSDHIINLASNEYFSAIHQEKLSRKLIDISFKEKQNDSYKIVGLFAKKARGLMANFIIKNKITQPKILCSFSETGYQFNTNFSTDIHYVFTR